MAFLLKIFSASERLKARQKSAALVNESFQAELSDVQTKVEVENYELQMLVEMIYDSSYPESQKFLKQPSKDRLYAHKETISSLLFGLAAQGVSVAPLILTHFQKHGCDGISDTLLTLLDLVRPLLDSRDAPLFTSDDILDAIDIQWHSSVRSSPAFASLRGSTTASPLQSPRHGFSNLSPRQSFSGELESVSGPVSPFTTHANRSTQDFSFSPPSEGVRAAAHEAPRRSLSFQYPGSERLHPLVEHEEEIGTGNVRKDGEAVHSSSLNAQDSGEFGNGLSIHIPRSATSFKVGDRTQVADEERKDERVDKSAGDGDAEVLCEGFSVLSSRDPSEHEVSENDVVVSSLRTDAQPRVEGSEQTVLEEELHSCDREESFRAFSTVAPVHSSGADGEAGEFGTGLPRSATSVEVEEFSVDQAQVPDEEPTLEVSHEQFNKSVGDVDDKVLCEGFSEGEPVPSSRDSSNHEVSEKDITPIKDQFHVGDSDQTSAGMSQAADEEPRLEFAHEQFDKSVGDGDAEVLCEGNSEGILESEAVPSSRDLSNHEVSEKDITPTKDQFHVGDSDQTSVGMSQAADEEPSLEFPHEQFDKSVGDGDAQVLCEGVSGGHADILESELAVPSSCEVSEKGIGAALPAKSQIHVEDSEQGSGDGESVGRTQLELSHEQFDKSAHEVVFQEDTSAKDTLEESDQVPSCDLSNHEDVVTLSIKNQRQVEDSEPTVIVEELTSTDNSLISKAGMEEGVPNPQDAVTITQLKSEVCEQSEGSLSESSNGRAPSLQGESSLSAQGTEKSTPIQGDSKDNIQNEMVFSAEEISLVTNEAVETVGKDEAMEYVEEVKGVKDDGAKEGLEEDGKIMEEGGSMKSAGEDVLMEEDRVVEGVKEDGEILEEGGLTKSLEEDGSMEGYLSGVGEAEFQEQEPASDPRSCCIAQSKTDMVSQSSFSDHYDGDEATTRSSDEGTSSSSEDGEEAMPVEKRNHQISAELETENVGNPELAAALHSPSYNLVTFDLSKLLILSTDAIHQDIQGGAGMYDSISCAEVSASEQKVTLTPASEEVEAFSHSHADCGSTSLQNADIPMKQESHDAEVFEGRNDKLRVPRGDSEVTNSGENLEEVEEAQITKTGSEDSSKSGGEVMVSTKSELDPGNDLKERDSPRFSSTIDEQDRVSLLTDQAEGDSPELEHQSKEKEGVPRAEKEKDSVVHVDEGVLAESQGEEEEQEIKQVLEGVNYEENGPSTLDVHVDESTSHPVEDLDDKEKDLVVMSPTEGDIKQVLNHSQKNGVSVPTNDQGELVVLKLSESGFKELEMKDMSTQADDETKKMRERCKISHGISSMERDDKIQMENPQSLDKEKHERHSIRDSLICTPDGSARTHKNGRRRRYNFLPTWCCSCCSKPSIL